MCSDKSVYINFVPVSEGGGLQNALSFIHFLNRCPPKFRVICIARKGSEVARLCVGFSIPCIEIRNGKVGRFLFEFFQSFFLIERGSVLFTLFGPPPIAASFFSKCINGCAYSNILYPEIDFWKSFSFLSRLKKKVIDIYRKWVYIFSDVVIFETDVLSRRAEKDFVFKRKEIVTVKMAPSLLVKESAVVSEKVSEFRAAICKKEAIRILYLSGPHPNKRHAAILRILAKANKIQDRFRLVVTLPKGSYVDSLHRLDEEIGGGHDTLINVGAVKQGDVASLIAVVDAMVNVSVLESFSNNFVEAWEMKKPLIVTDADWSRASCGSAAFYIDPEACDQSVIKIIDFFENLDIESIKKESKIQMESLPSRKDRFDQYMGIILKARL